METVPDTLDFHYSNLHYLKLLDKNSNSPETLNPKPETVILIQMPHLAVIIICWLERLRIAKARLSSLNHYYPR